MKLKAREARAAEAIGESLFLQMLLDYAELRLTAQAEGAGLPDVLEATVGELGEEGAQAIAAELLLRGWRPPSRAEAWDIAFRLLPYTKAKVRAPAPPMQIRTEGPVEIIFGGEESEDETED